MLSVYTPLLIAGDIFPAHSGGGSGLKGLVITFIIALIVLAIIAGLIWVIETYINKAPLPAPVRLVIALILIVLLILWAISNFM